MKTCERCGSYAINHNCHGRDGKSPDLCDVCYWREKAEKLERELAAAQSKINELHRRAQRAEAACEKLADDWLSVEKPRGGNFGRALLASAYAGAKERIAELEKELAAFVNELDCDGNVVFAMVELKKLKAENEWHTASVRPTHNDQIIICSAGGMRLTGNRNNLMESDKWREMPTPPKEGA